MLRLSAIMLAALLAFEPILSECCDDFSCHIFIGSYHTPVINFGGRPSAY